MAVTQNTYTGNGSNTNFSITFEYLKQSDVKASIDGTATTAFTLSNATTLSFNTAPANGAAVRIFRDTDISSLKATFFPGSAIKAEDLNDNFTQNNFATQETDNEVIAANTTAASAVTTAQGAVTTANAATVTAGNAVTTANASTATANTASTNASNAVSTANSAQTTVATYVHDGTNPAGDGVGSNPQGLAYAINTANTASTNSSNAVTTANTADTNATAALNNSRESDGQGGFTSAISKSNTAITTANSATTTANAATTTANSASTTVSTYVHDGTNPAGDGVGSNPQGLAYALNQASSAVATANAASAAVSAAAFYTPIAALANLPSSPSNEDRVEVVNSTGVESNSAVSGVPSGFVGSTDLTIRLQYNSSTTKWEWQQYFAADPENRYATSYLPVIKGDGTSSGQVGKITLNCSNNNHGVSIQSPPHSAGATYTLTLPTGTGTNGQFLSTNGSGVLSWGTVDLSTRLALAGGTMTGALTLSGAPTANLHAATKAYVDSSSGNALPLSGGTMTGAITLSGAPTASLHASTKQYVDDNKVIAIDAGNFDNGSSTISSTLTIDGGSF